MRTTDESIFQGERLRATVDALVALGPRPPTSRSERAAAEYVRASLEALPSARVADEFFSSPESFGQLAAFFDAVAAVAPLLPGRLGRLAGGAALLAAALGFRRFLLGERPSFAPILAQGVSQNVVARFGPADAARRVYVVTNLDAGKPRLTLPLPLPELTRPVHTAGIALMATGGALLLLDGLRGRRGGRQLAGLTALFSAGGLAALLADERQPATPGANDNASGVAVALALAEALHAAPPVNAEVVLLFSGCADAGNAGLLSFLERHAPGADDDYWLVLRMVGRGRLGFAHRQGVTLLSAYRPGGRITAIANRVAAERPELRARGRDVVSLDETASLRRRGHEAITITGWDDQGFAPGWHRADDTADKIEPDTLRRAAEYAWAIIRELDRA